MRLVARARQRWLTSTVSVAETIGSYYYGAYHPMKPFRITMAHHLVLAYDLHKHLDVFKPPVATSGATTTALDCDSTAR